MTQVSTKSIVFCVVNFHLWREVDEISGRDLMSFYVRRNKRRRRLNSSIDMDRKESGRSNCEATIKTESLNFIYTFSSNFNYPVEVYRGNNWRCLNITLDFIAKVTKTTAHEERENQTAVCTNFALVSLHLSV
jgi:hypothetical protein